MNTRFLMMMSAIVMAIVGIACSFFPGELLNYLGLILDPGKILVLIVQILGALYLGFAILNWMAKGNLIGGIYSKPVALGNFMHFLISALALIKYFMAHPDQEIIIIPAVIYAALAFCFGIVTFGSPVLKGR
ncbi:MAG: hypothetical protein V4541_00165 [Bacteroidota bacterium]